MPQLEATVSPSTSATDCPGDPGIPDDEPGGLKAGFAWGMSRYDNRNGDRFPDPVRTPEEAQAGDLPVVLDGCHSRPGDTPIVAYEWDLNGATVTGDCRFTWQAPGPGQFPVSLTVSAADGSRDSQTQLVTVRGDLLVVSLGDSLASGQGNPHSPKADTATATWEDARCHRSAIAGSAQAAAHLEGADPSTSVTFVHLACSGAKIEDPDSHEQGGLLDPYEGQDDAFKGPKADLLPPQVDELKRLIGNREIDVLMLSIGINDIEFGTIVDECIRNANCERARIEVVRDPTTGRHYPVRHIGMEELFSGKLAVLPERYDRLAEHLAKKFPELARDPSRVFINQYPDPTHGSDGRVCESMITDTPIPYFGFRGSEPRWASTVGRRLNEAVAAAASKHRWTVIDGVAERYQRNGECADDPWFVRYSISEKRQGNKYGTLHPNEMGHHPMRIRFLEEVRPTLTPAPPRIIVTSLAPGGSYLSGITPSVIVYDPIGVSTSATTLDGMAYNSGTPISGNASHTLVVSATNTAGLTSMLTIPFSIGRPEVASLSVAPSTVVGGAEARATVELNGIAPVGGVTVEFNSSNSGVASPVSSVLIPEGSASAEVAVTTSPVQQNTAVTIGGSTSGGTEQLVTLTVEAPRVTGFRVTPRDVEGGTSTTATVHLNGRAPAGGLSLTWQSSHPAVVPGGTLVVPASETAGQAPVPTTSVSSPVAVTLSITGRASEATVNVFPATVVVPLVIGLSEEVAVSMLRDEGLTWALTGEFGHPNSKVLRQNPRGDTEVDFGTTVTLEMTTNEKM